MSTALRRLLSGLRGLCLAGAVAGCTPLGLNYASLEIDNKPAVTPELGTDFNPQDARDQLARALYGPWPEALSIASTPPRLIDPDFMSGRGTLEEIQVTIGTGAGQRTFPVVLALPNRGKEDGVALILSQTFVDNCAVFPESPVTGPDGAPCQGSSLTGLVGFAATRIFGRYIAEAPLERYLDAGLAYASFSGAGFIPDRNGPAQATMAALEAGPPPTSALMGWAFAYHAVAKELSLDPRIDARAVAAMGHSRYGKSALIAAAWSDQVDAAIAHQSGFAGAASVQSETGETLRRMARSYPHWVRPGLLADLEAGRMPQVDQHMLMAAAAPKPLFLGNARRDVWSDPNSTYRMARAAGEVYAQSGLNGLIGRGLLDFHPEAEISYWLRGGGHSVVSRDIDAFIDFMRAHFESDQASRAGKFD